MHRPLRMKNIELKEEFIRAIGKRIREIRKEKGYTNAEIFAYEHEISRSQYNRYEKGTDMRISSLLNVTKKLDVSLQDFFSSGFDCLHEDV